MYSCLHGKRSSTCSTSANQCLWCHVTTSSPICWSATAERAAPEAEYICPAGFLCDWPVGVEFATGLSERPGSQQRHFLQTPKCVSLYDVLIHIAHYRFYDDALCKSTFYLLYLGVLCWQEHNLRSSLSGVALFCLRGRCTPHTSIWFIPTQIMGRVLAYRLRMLGVLSHAARGPNNEIWDLYE